MILPRRECIWWLRRSTSSSQRFAAKPISRVLGRLARRLPIGKLSALLMPRSCVDGPRADKEFSRVWPECHLQLCVRPAVLTRHETERGREVPPAAEGGGVDNHRGHCAGQDRSVASDGDQAPAGRIVAAPAEADLNPPRDPAQGRHDRQQALLQRLRYTPVCWIGQDRDEVARTASPGIARCPPQSAPALRDPEPPACDRPQSAPIRPAHIAAVPADRHGRERSSADETP